MHGNITIEIGLVRKKTSVACFNRHWGLLLCALPGQTWFSINHRRACAARVTVVGSVCLSVTLHLTSRVFVRLTKDTTYLTGNEGQKFCAVFSENAPLQS